jgi:hypothetical protein
MSLDLTDWKTAGFHIEPGFLKQNSGHVKEDHPQYCFNTSIMFQHSRLLHLLNGTKHNRI